MVTIESWIRWTPDHSLTHWTSTPKYTDENIKFTDGWLSILTDSPCQTHEKLNKTSHVVKLWMFARLRFDDNEWKFMLQIHVECLIDTRKWRFGVVYTTSSWFTCSYFSCIILARYSLCNITRSLYMTTRWLTSWHCYTLWGDSCSKISQKPYIFCFPSHYRQLWSWLLIFSTVE